MRQNDKNFLYFGIPYAVFFFGVLALTLAYSKSELHMALTANYSPAMDLFFRYFTEMGASIPYVMVGVLLLYRFRASLYLLGSLLIGALITNGLKRIFSIPRPKTYFSDNFPDVVLHQVEGVGVHAWNSFPSGHTTAAFAMMACIALMANNKYVSMLCIVLAVLAGYSRIYLSQHFAEDVLAGSFVGFTCALALYPMFRKMNVPGGWADESLRSVVRRTENHQN